ncbi:MAG: nucleoside deaminase [Burkholderiaceae bacterium]|nr:nucleoside deaminase [Burkholderiaceae bacterium]
MSTLLPEQSLEAADAAALRRAIALSDQAASLGSRPFGAVIVAADGRWLAEGHNNNAASGDCTAHAEVMALRQAAAAGLRREQLAGATMVASGEPCVMCAGAIFWSGLRRVVFGIDAERLRGYRRLQPGAADLLLSCRQVFEASDEPFNVIGPALLDEAAAPHDRFWSAPPTAPQGENR